MTPSLLTRADVASVFVVAFVYICVFLVWLILIRFVGVPVRPGAYAATASSFVATIATGVCVGLPMVVNLISSAALAATMGAAFLFAEPFIPPTKSDSTRNSKEQ
jgi:hypothetical protein